MVLNIGVSHCLLNCNAYHIEDEFHVFFQCTLYDDIIQVYLLTDLCIT